MISFGTYILGCATVPVAELRWCIGPSSHRNYFFFPCAGAKTERWFMHILAQALPLGLVFQRPLLGRSLSVLQDQVLGEAERGLFLWIAR